MNKKGILLLLICIAVLGGISFLLITAPKAHEKSDNILKNFKAVDRMIDQPPPPPQRSVVQARFDSLQEEEAMNVVGELPIVKKKSAEIEKLSNGKHHLAIYISAKPDDKNKFYTVSVAEDNGDALVPFLVFHVEHGTMKILNKSGKVLGME